MSWNDERVELLKKLWSEGLSASQIASRLGGVTRNAVIGKVHRLGLSGRATTSRVKVVRPRKRANNASARSPRANFYANGAAAGKAPFDPAFAPQELPQVEELHIPLEERVSLVELKEGMCRWPIGDPTQEDFHFCGRSKVPGMPYCEFHARVAYQPVGSRRRSGTQAAALPEQRVALKA